MKSCFCTIGRKTEPLETALDLASRCGFEGVELWGKEPHMSETFDAGRVSRAREAILTRDLAPLAYGSYVGSLRDGFDEELAKGREALRIAKALGAPLVRVWAGHVSPAQAAPECWEAAVRLFKTLAASATDAGLILAVERHDNSLTETVCGAIRLFEEVDHPAFRLNFQMRYVSGEDAVSDIRRFGSLIAHVHAHNLERPRDEAGGAPLCPLRLGYVDWRALAGELRAAGFRGAIAVEHARTPPPEDHLRDDAAFLKQIRNEALG